jgi:transposase
VRPPFSRQFKLFCKIGNFRDIAPKLKDRVRAQIFRDQGFSQSVVAHILGRNIGFVKYWRGRTNSVQAPGGGAARKLTRHLLHQIEHRVYMKRGPSLRSTGPRLGIPRETMRRACHSLGLHPYHIRKGPNITGQGKKDRVKLAKLRLNDDWRKTVVTDEKKVVIGSLPNSKNVIIWARPGDFIPPHPTNPHPLSINVSAAVSYYGKSDWQGRGAKSLTTRYMSVLIYHTAGSSRIVPNSPKGALIC